MPNPGFSVHFWSINSFQVIEDMKREMEESRMTRQQQPKFEDLFEPTVEEEDDDDAEEGRFPGKLRPFPGRSRPLSGNTRRASAGAVVSEDFDQILLFEDAQRIREREERESSDAMEVESLDGGGGKLNHEIS